MKGVQEKESIKGVRGIEKKNRPPAITVWHRSASLMMPDIDPREGLFYLPSHTNDRFLYFCAFASYHHSAICFVSS